MDVTKLPFNHFIGLKISNKREYLLMLDNRTEYRNQYLNGLLRNLDSTGNNSKKNCTFAFPNLLTVKSNEKSIQHPACNA